MLLQERDQFQQAEGVARASANVERLPGQSSHVLLCEQKRLDQVSHEQYIANLAAVAEERQRAAVAGANEEMRHPALILVTKLMGTIDATHAENHRWQIVRARIVEHVLVRGSLGAAIRAVKVEWTMFTDAVFADFLTDRHVALPLFDELDVVERSIHLISGGEDQWRSGPAGSSSLQHIECAAGVDLEVLHRR